jgi:hypothetical protein
VEAVFDSIAAIIETPLDPITLAIQPRFDPIAFLIKAVRQSKLAVSPRLRRQSIEPVIDTLTAGIETIVDPFAAPVQTVIESISSAVEAGIETIAAPIEVIVRVPQHRKSAAQSQNTQSDYDCFFHLESPSIFVMIIPLAELDDLRRERFTWTNAGKTLRYQRHLTGQYEPII